MSLSLSSCPSAFCVYHGFPCLLSLFLLSVLWCPCSLFCLLSFILTFAHQYSVCSRIRPLIWPWAVDFHPTFRIPASIWTSEHNKLCVGLRVWLAKVDLDNGKNSRARLPGVWLQGKLMSGVLAHPSAGHGSLMLFLILQSLFSFFTNHNRSHELFSAL